MERGRVQAAFFSSSDKCAVESAPVRYATGAFKPTRQANPTEGQSLLSNSVKTDEVVPRGAIILHAVRLINRRMSFQSRMCGCWAESTHQSTIRKAKKPSMWTIVIMPSMSGNFRKNTVLAKILRSKIAQEIKAVCQAVGT